MTWGAPLDTSDKGVKEKKLQSRSRGKGNSGDNRLGMGQPSSL